MKQNETLFPFAMPGSPYAPIATDNPYDAGYALDANRRMNLNDPMALALQRMFFDRLRQDAGTYDVPAATQRQAKQGGAAMAFPRLRQPWERQ